MDASFAVSAACFGPMNFHLTLGAL